MTNWSNGSYRSYVAYLLLMFLFIITTQRVTAQSKVLINEFLVDPQPQQAEIINTGLESIDISGWVIDDSGGTTFYTIPQNNILYPNSCLLFSGDFNLNKSSSDMIRLFNGAQLIDSFSYKASSGSGLSYLRLPDGSSDWSTGSATLGLFNSSKLSCLITPTLTVTPEPSPSPIQIPTPTLTVSPTVTYLPLPISYQNIYLSEVMVNPQLGNNEWFELYNDNDFSVSLTNWYIDDLENAGSSAKTFSLDIPSKSYRIFNLSTSMFNNDGDSVRLLDFDKNLKDDFEFSKSSQDKTFGRTSLFNDYFCLQEPSYQEANNPCFNITPMLTLTPTTTPTVSLTNLTYQNSKPMITNAVSPQAAESYPSPIINDLETEKVLGITTSKSNNSQRTVRFLSFISFSYSLLTLGSLLIKMKLNYEKNNQSSPSLLSSSRAK